MKGFYIRSYQSSDLKEIAELFYNTVHSINARDYTYEQLDAWATGNVNLDEWNKTLSEHFSLVAMKDDNIVGFGDMDAAGYLDRLYVHKDYQRQGIATAICDALESAFAGERMSVHASITAKPFFIKRGYKVIKEQQVVRNGILITNFVMER